MLDIDSITVSDQFGLDSLVIDFTILDTREDLFNYRFDLYKSNHQTEAYFLLATNITDFTYRDTTVNLYDVSTNYYYKVKVTDTSIADSQMSTVYGEYKNARADINALALLEIHEIYLQNVVTNKMILVKRKRVGQICTCFDT